MSSYSKIDYVIFKINLFKLENDSYNLRKYREKKKITFFPVIHSEAIFLP